jgi:hypothetical protein
LSEKATDSKSFYHESFQARKGYDTSSMVKFASSIPNMVELNKKTESELDKLELERVEWSTVNNNYQPSALQSIKFFFSDGSSSPEWGQRDNSSLQSHHFAPGTKIGSIGFDYGNFYVLQVTFMDEANKVLVRCGHVGDDSKMKRVIMDSKIIHAYGASSIDNKCVGMVGFTFYQQSDPVI